MGGSGDSLKFTQHVTRESGLSGSPRPAVCAAPPAGLGLLAAGGPAPLRGSPRRPAFPSVVRSAAAGRSPPIRTRLAGARGGSGGSVHDGVRAGREKPQRLAAVGLWGLNRPSLQEKAPLPLTTLFRARAHNGF